MRHYLNIGEAAKLMKMTTSQIRYYEKEGLIRPKAVDDNKYRLYDFKQLETLEIIVLLKDMGMPLKKIKEMLEDPSKYDYKKILTGSLETIHSDINRLLEKKTLLENRLTLFNTFQADRYEIKSYDERVLYIIEDDMNIETSAKEVYDFTVANKLNYTNYEADFYYISKSDGINTMALYEAVPQKDYDLDQYVLDKGAYFSITTGVESYSEADFVFEKLQTEAKKKLTLTGERIQIEDLGTLLYSRKYMYLTVQMKID